MEASVVRYGDGWSLRASIQVCSGMNSGWGGGRELLGRERGQGGARLTSAIPRG